MTQSQRWPALPLGEWKDTYATLHMWTQVVGKVRLALSPDNIDLLLLYMPGNFLTQALDQVEKAAAASNKAIVVIDTFAMADQARLSSHGIGYFDDFDRAARAISASGAWKRTSQNPPLLGEVAAHSADGGGPHRLASLGTSPKGGGFVAEWLPFPAGRSALSETEAKQALARFGVPVVLNALVHSETKARSEAARIGFPLVAKLVSPDVAHKTEHGLIRLGLASEGAVADAFNAMMAKATAMNVDIEGVALEPMLTGGVEILAGVTRDAVFGWMLTVGLGGVWTELMKDACHALLPVSTADAEAMLRSLKGFKLLDGYRGAPKADLAAAASAIAALGEAVLAGGDRLREVEVNPLLVLPEGKGAFAVDALVLLKEE